MEYPAETKSKKQGKGKNRVWQAHELHDESVAYCISGGSGAGDARPKCWRCDVISWLRPRDDVCGPVVPS